LQIVGRDGPVSGDFSVLKKVGLVYKTSKNESETAWNCKHKNPDGEKDLRGKEKRDRPRETKNKTGRITYSRGSHPQSLKGHKHTREPLGGVQLNGRKRQLRQTCLQNGKTDGGGTVAGEREEDELYTKSIGPKRREKVHDANSHGGKVHPCGEKLVICAIKIHSTSLIKSQIQAGRGKNQYREGWWEEKKLGVNFPVRGLNYPCGDKIGQKQTQDRKDRERSPLTHEVKKKTEWFIPTPLQLVKVGLGWRFGKNTGF